MPLMLCQLFYVAGRESVVFLIPIVPWGRRWRREDGFPALTTGYRDRYKKTRREQMYC